MGRMYGRGKGISSSALPYRRRAPSWLKVKPEEVVEHICKLAKKGRRWLIVSGGWGEMGTFDVGERGITYMGNVMLWETGGLLWGIRPPGDSEGSEEWIWT